MFWRLSELLVSVDRGEVVLPSFQRDFAWSERHVRALLATVVMGWPAGSLLAVQDDLDFGQVKPFDHGPQPSPPYRLIVLDGQQRLTALYHSMMDVGPTVYAIRPSVLSSASIEEVEAGIEAIDRETWDARTVRSVADRSDPLIPFSALRSTRAFLSWHDSTVVSSQLNLNFESQQTSDPSLDAYNASRHRIGEYSFPVTLIDRPQDRDDLARIFERVNRTGLSLGAFDLVVARVYGTDFNLRDEWEDLKLRLPDVVPYLGQDGFSLLQVMALQRSADVRRSAVLLLDPAYIRASWDPVVEATAEAVRLLRDVCGVLSAEWLPYRGMVVALASALLDQKHQGSDVEGVIRKWFFSRVFSLTYEVAANTRLVSDAQELSRALSGAPLPASAIKWRTLAGATRRSHSALWGGFLSALAANGGIDLQGVGIAYADVRRYGPDAVGLVPAPVFPKPKNVDRSAVRVDNLVLSQVLCDRPTARLLVREGVAGLAEGMLASSLPPSQLAAQFLPSGIELLDPSSAREFVERRKALFGEFLTARIGLAVIDGERDLSD